MTERFPIQVGPLYRLTPDEAAAVEDQPEASTRWTLHLRCGDTLDDVRAVADRVWATFAECLTAYWGGDSFAQWCEEFEVDQFPDNPGRALHVEFVAPGKEAAVRAGETMARLAGFTSGRNAGITPTANHDYYYEILPLTEQEQREHDERLARIARRSALLGMGFEDQDGWDAALAALMQPRDDDEDAA